MFGSDEGQMGTAITIVWGGRFIAGLFCCSGAWVLFPPEVTKALLAIFLFFVALIFVCVTNFLAYFAQVLATIPHDVDRLDEAMKVERQMFAVFTNGFSAVKRVFRSTLALTRHSNR